MNSRLREMNFMHNKLGDLNSVNSEIESKQDEIIELETSEA